MSHTPSDYASELVWKNKAHLSRQRQSWRFFARAVLIFGVVWGLGGAVVRRGRGLWSR
jgi:hypothetical protein